MAAAEARTEHPLAFTLWRQEDGQTVESPALGRERTVSVLTLWGERPAPAGRAPSLAPAAGNGCPSTDDGASLGDARAEGQKVRWNGRDYTVRGVFDAPEATSPWRRTPRRRSSSTASPRPSGGNRAGARRNSPCATACPGNASCSTALAALARFFCLLPALAAACSLAVRFFGRARARRDWPVQRALLWIAAVARPRRLWLAGVRPAVPQDLIPTRWSDFPSGRPSSPSGAPSGRITSG
ncbi:MAG: hypothetical protein ACLVL7_10930 [Anaerotruncus massiliensis (ex Togo et al. 2019)]